MPWRDPDLNLLVTLDVLLAEGSVARAARRLRLSPSAMSRALARLRETTGDPLLVRAGRGLVPTPRALELRERVRPARAGGEATCCARPGSSTSRALDRTFTLRTSEGFVENFGPALLARVGARRRACGCASCRSSTRTAPPLREGTVDLETGVVGPTTGPELRAQALFRDRFVGVVRAGHPLRRGDGSPPRAMRRAGTSTSRATGPGSGPGGRGPRGARAASARSSSVVGGFADRARPGARHGSDRHASPSATPANLRDGMHSFPLPVATPEFTVSLLWHPRMDADPAHRWLRGCVRAVCAELKLTPGLCRAARPRRA